MSRRISILGSTGSIGRSALEVVRRNPDRYEIVALSAGGNIDLITEQIAEFAPRHVVVSDAAAAAKLAERFENTSVAAGEEALADVAAIEVDVVLCGVVGAIGLKPVLSAIDAGNRVALANKEPIVMAGSLIMKRAREHNIKVLPVDSEHSAIFQCLGDSAPEEVLCIHLTASGGPFYKQPRETLTDMSPEQATNHPTWDMGAKISVDSATLMNKGLETIEAMWLFDLPLDKIQPIIHPQSIVHSLVEFTDGQILAHLGPTDMMFPIQYALNWPDRVEQPLRRLDLTTMKDLTFDKPDFSEFPCLGYAIEAARAGGTTPTVLNAANETAVEAFCNHRIGFLDISDVVCDTLDRCNATGEVTLETVLATDAEARRLAEEYITSLGVTTGT